MNNNFLKPAIDNISASICIFDSNDTILYCNNAFYKIFCNNNKTIIKNYTHLPEEYKNLSMYRHACETFSKAHKTSYAPNGNLISTTITPIFQSDNSFAYYVEEMFFDTVPESHTKGSVETVPENFSESLILSDKAMFDINQTISRTAYFDSTILIQGESGTGKSALAHHIHKNSNRAKKPFVTINCGAIPENLIESELFGYAPSAFTSASKKGKAGQIELADGGTLFLDEIGLLPYSLQSKLLHFIQEKSYTPVGGLKSKTVDVRIIAATNEDLKQFIAEKKFREDLYYRLRVIELFIPPLRERPDAIELLIHHFLENYNRKFGKSKNINTAAISMLQNYNWPGNIRELQYVMERIVLISEGNTIKSEDIPPLRDNVSNPESQHIEQYEKNFMPFDDAVAEFEKQLLSKIYNTYPSSYKIAEVLGITQTRASRLLRKYQISSKLKQKSNKD